MPCTPCRVSGWSRWALVAAFIAGVLGGARTAVAARTYPVLIESDPPGAALWIGQRDGQPDGVTPFRGRLRAGRHRIILAREGFHAENTVIRVRPVRRRRGRRWLRRQRFEVALRRLALSSFHVQAPPESAAIGAVVFLDGNFWGTVPGTFQALEGPHRLAIAKKGYRSFAIDIELRPDSPVEVVAALEPLPDPAAAPSAPAASPRVVTEAGGPAPEDAPRLDVDAGMGLGWRDFSYRSARTDNLREHTVNGFGVVELGARLHGRHIAPRLRHLSLFGRLAVSLPLRADAPVGGQELAGFWLQRELGVRADSGPWLPGAVALAVEVAEGSSRFSFRRAGALADEVPETSYEYLRTGLSAGAQVGPYAFGLGADALWVLAAGGVADRFADAAVLGARVHTRAHRRLGARFDVSLHAAFTRFTYVFATAPGGAYDADGGRDRMIQLAVRGSYRF